jgi:hypothetical protein
MALRRPARGPAEVTINFLCHALAQERARVELGGAPELLQRLAYVYLGQNVKFPPMDDPPPGYVLRIAVERIGGVGPWIPSS